MVGAKEKTMQIKNRFSPHHVDIVPLVERQDLGDKVQQDRLSRVSHIGDYASDSPLTEGADSY